MIKQKKTTRAFTQQAQKFIKYCLLYILFSHATGMMGYSNLDGALGASSTSKRTTSLRTTGSTSPHKKALHSKLTSSKKAPIALLITLHKLLPLHPAVQRWFLNRYDTTPPEESITKPLKTAASAQKHIYRKRT
jgi:hypothetical protein